MNQNEFGRFRIVLSAKITGKDSPVCLKSYLRFVHYRRPPLPALEEEAKCKISLHFDSCIGTDEKGVSLKKKIYSGFLLFSKKLHGKEPGYYLPAEALENLIPKIVSFVLKLQDEGWNMSDVKAALNGSGKIPSKAFPDFAIPVSYGLFFKKDSMTVKTKRAIYERWIMKEEKAAGRKESVNVS